MYPRSKFQGVLLEIRQEMAREADFDVDLFAEIIRTGTGPADPKLHKLPDKMNGAAPPEATNKTPRA